MIKFNDITFKYSSLNNPTIKNLTFEIKQGEKVLIVGKSGCGKSTVSKIINGLIPNSFDGTFEGTGNIGEYSIGKESVFSLSKVVGTILQDQDSQFIGLTAAEDIAFYLENCNTPVDEIHKKVDEILDFLHIMKLKNLNPHELSGGEKQRVSVAGVLVNAVNCLLLDEPLANLDPLSTDDILNVLDILNKEHNKTIIMIEHRLEDAFMLKFDRVIVIDGGTIISNTTPSDLLKTTLLTDIGIRKPLFIEALENINYDFTNVNDVFDFGQYNVSDIDFSKYTNVSKVSNHTNESIFSIKNLNFTYPNGREILKGINFEINEGEVVALLGNNGAGKSTLCKVILGINKNYTGEIVLDNENIDKLNIFNRGKRIGYVMQNPNHSITENTVFDEVAYSLKLEKLDPTTIESQVDSILDICGLLKYKSWPINKLSYGQKRRVTIAAVLVKSPKLIVLDEPTAGQDYETFESIMKLIKKLSVELNIAIVIITHNMQLAYEYCSRAMVLNDGKIIFNDTMDRLYAKDDILKTASLKETTIQSFAKYHSIDSASFGSLIKKDTQNKIEKGENK